MPKTSSRKALEVKIATVVSVVVLLHAGDLTALAAALDEVTGGQRDYFDHELAVLDVGALDLEAMTLDWAAMIELFRTYQLNPVAVRNAPASLEADLLNLGLSIDAVSKPRADSTSSAEHMVAPPTDADTAPTDEANARSAADTQAPAPAAVEVVEVIKTVTAPAPVTMVVDTPVRSGQRIYARGCDLIVTAVVNPGAEVIADGSIHVYAPLRGRALAGASGEASARIFALSMEAELVSIAGMYKTFEEGLPKEFSRHTVQVSLAGDRLDMRSIAPAPAGAHR